MSFHFSNFCFFFIFIFYLTYLHLTWAAKSKVYNELHAIKSRFHPCLSILLLLSPYGSPFLLVFLFILPLLPFDKLSKYVSILMYFPFLNEITYCKHCSITFLNKYILKTISHKYIEILTNFYSCMIFRYMDAPLFIPCRRISELFPFFYYYNY